MAFRLPETITVWTRANTDGLGGGAWSAPVQYPARIAYQQQKFTDINGDTRVSTAVCYSYGDALSTDATVYFGASVATEPPAAANDVRALSMTPSGPGQLKKAWFS